MDFLKQLIAYAILIALFWAGVVVVRMMSRAHVPSGYTDINGMQEFTSYRVDRNVTITQFQPGDALCYRISDQEEGQTTFGWVAGLPGDAVAISKGQLLVNGKPCERGDKILLPDCGPIQVPAKHLFVVSDRHERDSTARGPIPAIAIHGRLGALP
jgi:hypothetical protein